MCMAFARSINNKNMNKLDAQKLADDKKLAK